MDKSGLTVLLLVSSEKFIITVLRVSVYLPMFHIQSFVIGMLPVVVAV